MTEKTMERKRRYHQRHRRNTIATWIVGAVCVAMLVFLAAMGCMDYGKKLPPPESSGLPGLVLGESKQEMPVPENRTASPRSLRPMRTARTGTSAL